MKGIETKMLDTNNLIVREYKLWYPTFYKRTVDCAITGYHLLLAVLDDGTKLEFCSLDNSLRDVTRSYDTDYLDNMDDVEYRREFGDRLKTLLRDRNFRHDFLANTVGISRQSMSMYINGKAMPSIHIVRRIARALDCDIRDLVDFDYVLRD